jgi:hypothetical protein
MNCTKCHFTQQVPTLEEMPNFSKLGFGVITTGNIKIESPNSSVSTVTRLLAGRPSNRDPVAGRNEKCVFDSEYPVQLWDHPASYLMGSGGLFNRLGWPGRKADHTPASGANIKSVAIPQHFRTFS